MSLENALACQSLVKDYRGHKTVRALDNVSFSVPRGEVFGLLGPNGAGKTTLVKIFATLLKATSGSAEVGGHNVDKEEDKVRRIIGYAGQDSERSAYFRLSVRENLLYFAHALRDVPSGTVKERIDYVASSIGFSDRLDKHFIALSGGEKQLVIVMRAIMHTPEICFLDEPSKSLDPVTARNVREFLKSYAQEHNMTMCLTTHNMKEAEEFCDKIAFINHGQLQFIGTPSQFKRRVTVKEVIEIGLPKADETVEWRLLAIPGVSNITYNGTTTLYCDNAFAIMREVLAVLDKSGIKAPVSMAEPSLEDAFAFFVENSKGNHDA